MSEFHKSFLTLRSLGLVYSEPRLTQHNTPIITMRLRSKMFGTKGIGLIHEDNRVELRFVRGSAERHAEVVRILFEGLPGVKLRDDLAIREYLYGLPLGKITKIAGYELQLGYNENKITVVNINYASTILEIQVERIIKGQFLSISKQDFDRLNYAVLYSIDKNLLDHKQFQMQVEKKGNKINVVDKRIYPLK